MAAEQADEEIFLALPVGAFEHNEGLNFEREEVKEVEKKEGQGVVPGVECGQVEGQELGESGWKWVEGTVPGGGEVLMEDEIWSGTEQKWHHRC